jgi:hypothetical protein
VSFMSSLGSRNSLYFYCPPVALRPQLVQAARFEMLISTDHKSLKAWEESCVHLKLLEAFKQEASTFIQCCGLGPPHN